MVSPGHSVLNAIHYPHTDLDLFWPSQAAILLNIRDIDGHISPWIPQPSCYTDA